MSTGIVSEMPGEAGMWRPVLDSVARVSTTIYIVAGMLPAALAVLLVAGAETLAGRLFGLAVLLAFPIPVLLRIAGQMPRRRIYW